MQQAARRSAAAWPWMVIGSLCMSVEWLATLASLTTTSASALCLFYIAPLWAVPMGMVRDTHRRMERRLKRCRPAERSTAARARILSQVVNYDALHARTLVAMAVALAGILTIFAPNVLSSDSAAAAATTPAPVLTAFATPARHHTTVGRPEQGHRNAASLSGACRGIPPP